MKVIIAGSRGINSYDSVCSAVKAASRVFPCAPSEIVSGGARGVDALGERYAKEHSLSLRVFPAKWDTYGKSAGYRRNVEMSEYADALVAVWDGVSRGTMHMVDTMSKAGKLVFVYNLGLES